MSESFCSCLCLLFLTETQGTERVEQVVSLTGTCIHDTHIAARVDETWACGARALQHTLTMLGLPLSTGPSSPVSHRLDKKLVPSAVVPSAVSCHLLCPSA